MGSLGVFGGGVGCIDVVYVWIELYYTILYHIYLFIGVKIGNVI